MERYLIDTNVISDYFSASLSEKGMTLLDVAIDATPNLSIITQIELLCWKTDREIERQVSDFVFECNILEITPEVVKHCIKLRKGKKIKLPDAIIAATALANHYSIITNNEKDFLNIKDLKIYNPHKL